MEYINGVKVNDVKGIKKYGLNPEEVALAFNRIFNKQIFEHGFVHCDPHPGNVLVRPRKDNNKKPELILIDNGLYRCYDNNFRYIWSCLWIALINRDIENIKFFSSKLGIEDSYQLFSSILTAHSWNELVNIDSIYKKVTIDEKNKMQDAFISKPGKLTQVLQTVPSPVLLLLKTNDLIRLINRELGSNDLNVAESTLFHSYQTSYFYTLKSNNIMIFLFSSYLRYIKTMIYQKIKFFCFNYLLLLFKLKEELINSF